MFTKLAEKWRDNFNATVPSQPLGMNEWSTVVAFSWWLNKNAAEHSVHPTAFGVGMRARLGHWLVSLGQSLIQNGGG